LPNNCQIYVKEEEEKQQPKVEELSDHLWQFIATAC
jgi:hypothetical protein